MLPHRSAVFTALNNFGLEAAYGWIDGRAFYNLCRNFGGGDSTCFDCSKWHNVNTAIYCDVS
ncbi:uncharacterized protein CLUP02_02833 [Colletotrichum lupini]|uniref:Uncharacterized protein n=1 Tax=Colletotrichum lupini TaxID=145971 RepID=A0A9Q8SI31_9PEZI|nr:uncharacterized protein CLUP02_02833 [Colletotrichum lupini]UQC77365.1 hypothetical protein CLUP02_02833 [Colletotrichum lupini]